MGGERTARVSRAAPQPGGRSPAPGALAVVQAFLNTHFDLEYERGAELLSSPGALDGWLQRAELLDDGPPLRERDLRRALDLRESLRDFARDGAGSGPAAGRARRRLDQAAAGAAIEVRFPAGNPRFIGGGGIDGAFGSVLAIVAQSIGEGTWSRLKICPGHHCGWAFYDHSRNRAGRWCSMAVCGGREKARAHYRRRRAQAD